MTEVEKMLSEQFNFEEVKKKKSNIVLNQQMFNTSSPIDYKMAKDSILARMSVDHTSAGQR